MNTKNIKKWARIDDEGIILEIIPFDPEGKYFPNFVWVPVPEELVIYIDQNFIWNGIKFIEPEPGYLKQRILKVYVDIIQSRLNGLAQIRKYDDIFTAISYIDDENPKYAAEAAFCKTLRSRVWTKCYEIMGEVEKGLREIPELEDLFNELPEFKWPNNL